MKNLSIKNLRFGSRSNAIALLPCTDDLDYWSSTIDFENNLFLDKSGNGNDANLTASYCRQFDGVDDYCLIEENIVNYIDDLTILYSLDNITWNEFNLGDVSIAGLYQIINNKLYIGFDGTNYFTGYISRCVFKANSYNVLDFTFASNHPSLEFNRAKFGETENEFLFPFSTLSFNLTLTEIQTLQ